LARPAPVIKVTSFQRHGESKRVVAAPSVRWKSGQRPTNFFWCQAYQE
jgi:hypothetical protein